MRSKKVNTFEDLRCWQAARTLAIDVFKLTDKPPLSRDFGSAGHIRKTSLSVVSNIAEGFERGSKKELLQFLYIAKGSSGELRAQSDVMCGAERIPENDYQRLRGQCMSVSRQIAVLMRSLQKTDIKGHKYKSFTVEEPLAEYLKPDT